jgi:hypothetical protein
MALFRLFSSKKVANSDVNPVEINDEQEVNNENENPVEDPKEEESKKNLITITWGTGMPIDVIFNFIHKNFEEEGFQDALVNSDITYRDTKVKIIRYDLEMLFTRITLRYKNDIREVDNKIDNARKAFALSAAAKLDALKQTYEEHLAEIKEMQDMLEADDPKMTTMIESYRRGFMKGITASTINYIDNK